MTLLQHAGLALASTLLPLAVAAAEAPIGGPHDFDFEFGSWTAKLKRLDKPLSGSTTWVEYNGTSVVRKFWDGEANIGELRVASATNRLDGMTIRLYNAKTRQWNIYWSNSRLAEVLTPPMVGGFHDGRGEFYANDTLDGKPIVARFLITVADPRSFTLEQAFSPDDRKTWETNWVATFTKTAGS
ncbi:MAG TPA: hypothetical protein VLL50_12155 [Usitatibacter sp.]|nr:hypothetical protein [Usitatibacter sp.]